MLSIEFWTSDFDLKKLSKRPRDPHNRMRLEQLCPKVVSDRQNAGRMPSKQRFLHFRPIMENPGLNVNFSPKPWGHSTPQSTIPVRAKRTPDLEKIDIQSWVLIGSFSVNFRDRNGWEMAICPTKKRAD